MSIVNQFCFRSFLRLCPCKRSSAVPTLFCFQLSALLAIARSAPCSDLPLIYLDTNAVKNTAATEGRGGVFLWVVRGRRPWFAAGPGKRCPGSRPLPGPAPATGEGPGNERPCRSRSGCLSGRRPWPARPRRRG